MPWFNYCKRWVEGGPCGSLMALSWSGAAPSVILGVCCLEDFCVFAHIYIYICEINVILFFTMKLVCACSQGNWSRSFHWPQQGWAFLLPWASPLRCSSWKPFFQNGKTHILPFRIQSRARSSPGCPQPSPGDFFPFLPGVFYLCMSLAILFLPILVQEEDVRGLHPLSLGMLGWCWAQLGHSKFPETSPPSPPSLPEASPVTPSKALVCHSGSWARSPVRISSCSCGSWMESLLCWKPCCDGSSFSAKVGIHRQSCGSCSDLVFVISYPFTDSWAVNSN